MTATADLFTRVAALVLEIDTTHDPGPPAVSGPSAIRSIIHDTAGGWPGAGGGEPVTGGGTSDPTSSAAIRSMTRTGRDDTADLVHLDRAEASLIAAIGQISVRCGFDGKPTTWAETVKDCHLLAEVNAIETAITEGADLFRNVARAHDAITTIKRIHDGHCAHVADDGAKLMTGDPICLSHARIGDYDRPRHGKHHVCKTCYDLLAAVGHPGEQHHDPDAWPSLDLLRAHADMERTGKRIDYQRERSLWIDRRGIQRSA